MSDIYLSLTETPSVVTLSQPVISGALAATVTVGNTVTVALDANSLSALENVTVTVGAAVSVSNFPATQTIAGTVTANVNLISDQAGGNSPVVFGVPGADVNTIRTVIYSSANSSFGNDQGAPVDSENPLPISGTVTANGGDFAGTDGAPPPNKFVPIAFVDGFGTGNLVRVGNDGAGLPINLIEASNFSAQNGDPSIPLNGFQIGFVDANNEFRHVQESVPFPISGTVTAAAPNGSLTTRFGTPTTANTAFATAAVTKSDRKYLLIQNVTTGSNAITVGIGFTPTTTQGIQLTAGAGITFESSYIPTGAVYVLSSVTASNFTILEA